MAWVSRPASAKPAAGVGPFVKRAIPKLHGRARDVGKGEFIGLEVLVRKANDAGIVGLTGTVVDETLHTLTIRIGGPGGRRVQLAKVGAVFGLRRDASKDWVDVDGAAVEFRAEDRTKKVR